MGHGEALEAQLKGKTLESCKVEAEVERRGVEPSWLEPARKIAALAPASSALRATLMRKLSRAFPCSGITVGSPIGAAPLCGRKVPSTSRGGRGLLFVVGLLDQL